MIIKRIFFFLNMFFVLSFFSTGIFSAEMNYEQAKGYLIGVIISKGENTLEVGLICNFYPDHRNFTLLNPNQLVIDLFDISGILTRRKFQVNDFGIYSIRLGLYKQKAVRVVFEIEKEFPDYSVERLENGLKVIISKKGVSQLESDRSLKEEETEAGKGKKPAERAPEELAGETKKEEIRKKGTTGGESSEAHEYKRQEALEKITKELEETKKKIEEMSSALNNLQLEMQKQKRKFFRIETMGNYFAPTEETVKDVYKYGIMLGAEINLGISDFMEFWLAEKYFNKRAVDPVSGEERKISLIPIEAGLKLRLNKGVINPYLGAGGGYYQYKEILPAGEVKDSKFGYVGQAGIFFKIPWGFILAFYAHYSYCKINSGVQEINIGGLHLGAGFGFEF